MEKKYLSSSDKLSLKEEYKKSAGKKVPYDFFVYSCMAEDHTLQTLGDASHSNSRWPVLAERREAGKLDDPMPEKSFEECAQQLMQWYAHSYPELASSQALDHALCSVLVGKFMLMINDVRQLVFIKNNKGLPQIPSNESRPEIWDRLDSLLQESFPTYASYIMAYFKWVYAKPVERKIELADLPPVGRYFGILKDNLRSKGQRDGEENSQPIPIPQEIPQRKPDWGDKERENLDEPKEFIREPREPREAREPREPRESREPREPRERHERKEPRDRDRGVRGGRDRERGDRDRSGDDDKGKDKEKLALLEVDKAILALKKHSSMTEFRLRPQNSFIRRLQHRKINALGFQSHSVGDDDDRAVLITRED